MYASRCLTIDSSILSVIADNKDNASVQTLICTTQRLLAELRNVSLKAFQNLLKAMYPEADVCLQT